MTTSFSLQKARECWQSMHLEEVRCSPGGKSSSKDMDNVTRSSTENCGMALEVVDGEE